MKIGRNKRIILILFAGTGAIILTSLMVLKFGLANDMIVKFALKHAHSRLAGSVHLLELVGPPLDDPRLNGLLIKDPDGNIIFSASEIHITRKGIIQPHLIIEITGAVFDIRKINGEWNTSSLTRKRAFPKKTPMNFPILSADILIKDSVFIIAPSDDQEIKANILSGQASLRTEKHGVVFSVKTLRGKVENPALGVNQLAGSGIVTHTGEGWEVKIDDSTLVTASSNVILKKAKYYTLTSET